MQIFDALSMVTQKQFFGEVLRGPFQRLGHSVLALFVKVLIFV